MDLVVSIDGVFVMDIVTVIIMKMKTRLYAKVREQFYQNKLA